MPLSRALTNVTLTRACPHCGHNLQKMGRWFRSVSRYRCEACGPAVHVAYEDKVRLFDAHAHLADCDRIQKLPFDVLGSSRRNTASLD